MYFNPSVHTRHDVTIFQNWLNGIKYKSISPVRNIIFLWNEKKKFFNCTSKTTFSEVIIFLVEVTFNIRYAISEKCM